MKKLIRASKSAEDVNGVKVRNIDAELLPEFDRAVYMFNITGVNSTWNDDILKIVNDEGGYKVRFRYFNEDRGILMRQGNFHYIVEDPDTIDTICDIIKDKHIPTQEDLGNITYTSLDWELCYDIQVDDYDDGIYWLEYHKL